jgi:hypothetical protein
MNRHALLSLCLAVLCLPACATHHLRFKPMAGIPADEAAELARGEFRTTPDKLFDAAATTLEHEPYLNWSVTTLNKENGFLKASAGLLREVQFRVSAVDAAGASGSAAARSRLDISIPRRPLVTQAKIWTKANGFQTAYQPEQAELHEYRVTQVEAELDDAYLRSFTWRVLHDRSQVPFTLEAHDAEEPVSIQSAPAAAAVASASAAPESAAKPEAAKDKLPVRDDAGAPAK